MTDGQERCVGVVVAVWCGLHYPRREKTTTTTTYRKHKQKTSERRACVVLSKTFKRGGAARSAAFPPFGYFFVFGVFGCFLSSHSVLHNVGWGVVSCPLAYLLFSPSHLPFRLPSLVPFFPCSLLPCLTPFSLPSLLSLPPLSLSTGRPRRQPSARASSG